MGDMVEKQNRKVGPGFLSRAGQKRRATQIIQDGREGMHIEARRRRGRRAVLAESAKPAIPNVREAQKSAPGAKRPGTPCRDRHPGSFARRSGEARADHSDRRDRPLSSNDHGSGTKNRHPSPLPWARSPAPQAPQLRPSLAGRVPDLRQTLVRVSLMRRTPCTLVGCPQWTPDPLNPWVKPAMFDPIGGCGVRMRGQHMLDVGSFIFRAASSRLGEIKFVEFDEASGRTWHRRWNCP